MTSLIEEAITKMNVDVDELVEGLNAWAAEDTGSHEAGVRLICASAASLIQSQAARIAELEASNEILRGINANLMGDDENVPRYTTKRLRQEVASAVERALLNRRAEG